VAAKTEKSPGPGQPAFSTGAIESGMKKMAEKTRIVVDTPDR
jgi:hypothetical protein